ncbi:MAG: ATP-binding protein [Limnohabitans sp.]|nr:ATP-binding protein [Limnohabitans sp.]
MDWGSFAVGSVIGGSVAIGIAASAITRRMMRLRAAEARAVRQERLAEIGALTAGLAHEIKNPLSTIGLNVQLASEAISDSALPEDERALLVRRVETVGREATRLANILNDFLRFAGRIKLAPVETDLRIVIEELADFYRPQCDQHRVVLRIDLPPMPVLARVDPALVKQALLNLLINATQAITTSDAQNRELMIRLESATDAGRLKGSASEATRSVEVAIHVIDTGPGIAAEKHAEIFRPYVTGRKGGTGLGLAVTRRLIEEHGGRIEILSEVGRGSDFVIRLPIAGPTNTAESTASNDAEEAARRTVLDRMFRDAR